MDDRRAERPAAAGPPGAPTAPDGAGSQPPGSWAAPGSPSDGGGTRTQVAARAGAATAPPAAAVDEPAERAVVVPRPVPLRPLTVADVLDGAFAVIKARPRTVFAVTAVFVLPIELVAAWLQRSQIDVTEGLAADPTAMLTTGTAGDPGDLLLALLVSVGQVLALPFVGAALARLVGGWLAGVDLGPAALLGQTFRRAPALLGAFVLVHVAELLGLVALFVGALVPLTFFLVTAPAIALEGIGPVRGVSRSASLVVRRFWAVLLVVVLTFVLELALQTSLSLVPSLLALLLPVGAAWIVASVANVVGSLLVTPFITGVAVLVYLDLRIRSEGLDLELAVGDAFPRADG